MMTCPLGCEERIMSIESLVRHLGGVEDPRCQGKIEHRLIDILVIAVCAVIACAEESMQNRGVIKLLLAVPDHHSQAGSPDSVAGRRPQVCRSARPFARRGRVAPPLCSSASAAPCSCAWPRSH